MSISCLRARTLYFSAAIGVLTFGGAATAEPDQGAAETAAVSPLVEPSPFLGEWELDLTRMPDTYGAPPKRVTFEFEDIGSGEWRTTVEITAPDDSVRHAEVRYRRDGRAVQSEGDSADGDTAAFSSPAPNVLVMSQAKDGDLMGVRTYVVSADGQEMTEAAAGIDGSGTPFVRSFHFRRIR